MGGNAMFELLDQQKRLTGNQKKIVAAAIIGDALEFFDYFLIGFVLAFIIGPWKLTFGQSAIVLLSSGIGATIGAMFWGWMADRIGRRKVFIATVLNFSLATGLLYFTPDNGWIYLTFFRFFVGFGVGGLYCVDLPLVQEFVPSSKRGRVGGLVTVFIPVGVGLGAVLGAYLGADRLAGAVRVRPAAGSSDAAGTPVGARIAVVARPPGSLRGSAQVAGLGHGGRSQDPAVADREERARHADELARSLQVSPKSDRLVDWQSRGSDRCLWRDPMGADVVRPVAACDAAGSVKDDDRLTVSGLIGRISSHSSRRSWGGECGGSAGLRRRRADHAGGGHAHGSFIGGISAFWLILIAAIFFADGGFAIVGPYAAEVWPSNLRTSGMGSAYGFGGIGKIIGPLGLALIVGSSNFVKPDVPLPQIPTAFFYLGAWFVLAGPVYLFLGIETKGRSIDQIDKELAPRGRRPLNE